MKKLESYPRLAKIGPTVLSEIYGDLNIYNVLSRLGPAGDEPEAFIDPRGVPLLGDDVEKVSERGDYYYYDVSKLLFSLTGISEIRKRFFDYSAKEDSYRLELKQYPDAFFRDNGIPESTLDSLRIVHISSTGSSPRSQFAVRDNDKLLSPRSFGISPLKLALLQAT